MTLRKMKKITIFGRPGCGFCSQAQQLCENNSFDFTYVDIWAENISKEDLEKTIGKPVHTVPQIFHGSEHIGGFTEFDAFVKTSEQS
jgi:glutaredoxin 1